MEEWQEEGAPEPRRGQCAPSGRDRAGKATSTGGSGPGGTQLPALAHARKHGVIREASKAGMAKPTAVNPQPTWRAWFAQEVLPAAESWQMKQRECGHGHRKAVSALTAWPGRRGIDTVTGRLAPGTGDDAVPFTPFGSRPGGLAPTDPRVLGVGRQNLLKAPGTDVWFGGQPGPARTRPSKTWPAGDGMGWQEAAFRLAPVPHVLVYSPPGAA